MFSRPRKKAGNCALELSQGSLAIDFARISVMVRCVFRSWSAWNKSCWCCSGLVKVFVVVVGLSQVLLLPTL